MNSSVKLGKAVVVMFILAIAAIGAGLLIAWYLGSHGGLTPVAAAEPGSAALQTVPEPFPVNPVAPPVGGAGPSNIAAPWTNMGEEVDNRPWAEKLDGILLGAGEVNDKADAIKKLMATAPADAQVELSQHLINMVQDDHYDGAAELLTNAATPTAVSTVLMNDLLNRRNTLKLPMLLAIARNDDHPLKDQAKDMLELFLQADYNTNWDQWSAAVDTWLQQNQ